ncbi:Pr6Pr family membrane protein [Mucilaginibacter gynuensis]|uniref:Pr6Pr family membrane protein n=1 Tax=Mucilaginibacter gynuensis TaxID=1302236 RepID=A0ABP8H9F6_9SPHI
MKYNLKQLYTALTSAIIWFGLGLQFYISTRQYMVEGYSFAGALVQIISFFTIETNVLVAVALTSVLASPQKSWGKYFSRISVITAVTLYIVIVGLIYNTILKDLWQPKGLFKLTDDLLHTISPILLLLYWLIFVPKQHIAWRQMLPWLIFPFVYFIYSLIRGAITGGYPYGFIDAAKLGYQQIAINSVIVLILFLVIGSFFVLITKFAGRTNRA